jgi:hypothetical protein
MAQLVIVNTGSAESFDNRCWDVPYYYFNPVFRRTEARFRPDEVFLRTDDFFGGSENEIDWNKSYRCWGVAAHFGYLTPALFNIFYLRSREALTGYPDDDELEYEDKNPHMKNTYKSVVFEWQWFLRLFEIDKRFDRQWIENYQSSRAEKSIFGTPDTELRQYQTRKLNADGKPEDDSA